MFILCSLRSLQNVSIFLRFLRFSIEYSNFDFNKETLRAIQKNLGGVTKLSKERIFIELNKILKLKNFEELNKDKNFLEIFILIFPEFKYFDRVSNFSALRKLLPNILNNNHEYFLHKYNISNESKEHLNFLGKYFKEVRSNKNFFKKDLNKNIFLFGKEKIKSLFLLSNIIKKNFKPNEFIKNLSKIDDVSIPKFPITGEYLLNKGLKSGKKMGEAIQEIKDKWLENNFNLDDDQLSKTIKKFK